MLEKIPETNRPKDLKTEEQAKSFEFEEIAELEAPIKKIIEKLKERIDRGDYGLIIGDDASGRIPAIIIGGFIKNISEIKNMREPGIIFVPGKLDKEAAEKFLETEGGLDKYISKFGGTKEKRILIVTDTIMSGRSLSVLITLLKKNGYTPDIATLGVRSPLGLGTPEESLPNTEIISGEYGDEENKILKKMPQIYGAEHLSGVYKESGDIKSHALRGYESFVKHSREDSKKMTDKLVNWYQETKNE